MNLGREAAIKPNNQQQDDSTSVNSVSESTAITSNSDSEQVIKTPRTGIITPTRSSNGDDDDTSPPFSDGAEQTTPKAYKIRHFLLILFVLLSMSNSFHWIQYSIIEAIVSQYYHVSTFWINCTSVVYMFSYIIGIIPATYLQDRYGLKVCLIIGSFGNAFGSWIKCLSVERTRFFAAMIGQTFAAFAQLFILNIPPVLAATWFPSNEVTRATAYGVFGNQVGIALGFLIPPLLMPTLPANVTELNAKQLEHVERGFRLLMFGEAAITTFIFIAIVMFFKKRPKRPPSQAQALKLDLEMNDSKRTYLRTMKKLFQNRNFVFLLISYGMNTGVFYALSTVLSQMITKAMGAQYLVDAGYMGLSITISGIIGSIVCGYILGWSGKFKLVTLVIYLFSVLGTCAFTAAIEIKSLRLLYLACALLGFFMTGYLPIGFEFAAEVSYPLSEGISAGLLNAAAQVFGIIFTFGSTPLIQKFGPKSTNIGYIIVLAIGFVLTTMVENDLRRQNSQI